MRGRLEGLGGRLSFEFCNFLRKIDDTRVRSKTKKKESKIAIFKFYLFKLCFLRGECTIPKSLVYIVKGSIDDFPDTLPLLN